MPETLKSTSGRTKKGHIYLALEAGETGGQWDVSPSGKNQSACWMMGSMMATTWTEVAAAISASVLDKAKKTRRLVNISVTT